MVAPCRCSRARLDSFLLVLALLFFALLALDQGLQDLFLCLQVRVLAEQSVLVELEPLFGLDARPAQVDQVYEHGEEEDHQSDDHDDLEDLGVGRASITGHAQLNIGLLVVAVEVSEVGESGEGALTQSHLLVRNLLCQ